MPEKECVQKTVLGSLLEAASKQLAGLLFCALLMADGLRSLLAGLGGAVAGDPVVAIGEESCMPTYDVEMDLSTMQVGFMEGGSSVANVQECSEPNFALVVTANANLIVELSLLGFESTELVVSEGTSENLQESIDLTMSKVKAIADAEKQSSNQAESVVPRPQSVGKT
ncbi:hypothetical protein AMTR_s00068p00175660 [Amborella trichopoda]|uniref:Uncharacterized protein n=1 Tax=Amborella trichopoda TaxID=13333 RepID=U5DE50_AMBTC|nr:hypothetical protein AMTR_s00068p00175660 [Amborella trichopoda]